jgi:hypothetical protein
MKALDFLLLLESRGVRLKPDGEKLIVDAPAGALTTVDRDLLVQLKPVLLAILQPRMTPDELPGDWHFLWDERAAIMEFDGGLPRERAEVLALWEILQEMERASESPHST